MTVNISMAAAPSVYSGLDEVTKTKLSKVKVDDDDVDDHEWKLLRQNLHIPIWLICLFQIMRNKFRSDSHQYGVSSL